MIVGRPDHAIVFKPRDPTEEVKSLLPAERVFLYHMAHACQAANEVYTTQLHRHAPLLIKTCKELVRQGTVPRLDEYLVQLCFNGSQYEVGLHASHNKIVPEFSIDQFLKEATKLKLTPQELTDLKHAVDPKHEPTLVTSGSIDQSAVNLYAPDVTDQDFAGLSSKETEGINVYFEKKEGKLVRIPYSTKGHLHKEMTEFHHHLSLATTHANQHPECFDIHFIKSLQLLLKYIETGDEDFFKEHSKEWIQCTSRLDYVGGFIECYEDPKNTRSMFACEVTKRTCDMSALKKIMPAMERLLPHPEAFLRERKQIASTPLFTSINRQLIGGGANGPISLTVAYCLPNYGDIRSQHGSKQIIYQYHTEPMASQEEQVRLSSRHLEKYGILTLAEKKWVTDKCWEIGVLLHETIGHASCQNVASDTQIKSAIKDYSTMEELRAEIHALYLLSHCLPFLQQHEIFKLHEFDKYGMASTIDMMILNFARAGLRRLGALPENFAAPSGAHCRADLILTQFLLASGGLEIEETKLHDLILYTPIIADQEKCLNAIKTLAQKVQKAKSTADGQVWTALLQHLTSPLPLSKLQEIGKGFKTVQNLLSKGVRYTTQFCNVFDPIYKEGTLVDAQVRLVTDLVSHLSSELGRER